MFIFECLQPIVIITSHCDNVGSCILQARGPASWEVRRAAEQELFDLGHRARSAEATAGQTWQTLDWIPQGLARYRFPILNSWGLPWRRILGRDSRNRTWPVVYFLLGERQMGSSMVCFDTCENTDIRSLLCWGMLGYCSSYRLSRCARGGNPRIPRVVKCIVRFLFFLETHHASWKFHRQNLNIVWMNLAPRNLGVFAKTMVASSTAPNKSDPIYCLSL